MTKQESSVGGVALREPHVRRAIEHLRRLGDTDVLPALPEYIFFREAADGLVALCQQLTLGNYAPKSTIEILSPKSEYGFRIVHQLTAFDNLVYLTAAIACAGELEKKRSPATSGRAFSYRFEEQGDYLLFARDKTFHDWLEWNLEKVGLTARVKGLSWVALTDISDFYSRIYMHRVENVLAEHSAPPKAAAFAVKVLKKIRAEQSFGLPVGPAASRIIAEALLIDTDTFVESQGWDATRFVDDIRLFFKEKADAQAALAKLAQHLMVTEGLSLNSSKTKIVSVREFSNDVRTLMEDVFSKSEEEELDHLFRITYGEAVDDEFDASGSEIDDEAIVDRLREVVSEASDISRLRAVLRALRVHPLEDLPAFLNEFGELFLLVPKDMSLAISSSLSSYGFLMSQREANITRDALLDLLDTSPYQDMAIVRIWILDLFARGLIEPTQNVLSAAARPDLTALERRHILLIRARLNDKPYFRALKTRFSELSDWEKPIAMWAASCLPEDEYEKWITFAKGSLAEPYADVYASWLKKNHGSLLEILAPPAETANSEE
jgi:hypothetical protein